MVHNSIQLKIVFEVGVILLTQIEVTLRGYI